MTGPSRDGDVTVVSREAISRRTVVVGSTDVVLVVLHDDRDPDRADWDDLLEHVRATNTSNAARDLPFRQLVLTDGGAPSAGQRRRLEATVRGAPGYDRARIAVVTSDVIVRGITTLLSLAGLGIRAFGPSDPHAIERHLELASDQARAMWDLADALEAKMSPRTSETLALLRRARR